MNEKIIFSDYDSSLLNVKINNWLKSDSSIYIVDIDFDTRGFIEPFKKSVIITFRKIHGKNTI